MKASSAHRLLPFKRFGKAATFDLEVEVSCQCGRSVVIDGMAPAFRNRRIMGAVPLHPDPIYWQRLRLPWVGRNRAIRTATGRRRITPSADNTNL
jgi:hypothetical protein